MDKGKFRPAASPVTGILSRREDIYSRIDYLLVSPGLKPLVAGGRAKIWDGPGTTEASDHRAVFMSLQLTAAR